MELLIVTGMSGAGKTRALQNLEDMGYYCVDNLPPQLILYLLDSEMHAGAPHEKTAVTIDIRSEKLLAGIDRLTEGLAQKGVRTRILFLDASDNVLKNRYKESRRLHPLIQKGDEKDLGSALKAERSILAGLRSVSDIILDTSRLSSGGLRQKLIGIFGRENGAVMTLEFVAFGYKYGILADADLVFDVRCLPNPYYVDELRCLTGEDQAVRDYVLGSEEGRELYRRIEDLLEYSIPLYMKEGKSRLVVGLGCTGGQHRSLAFAAALKEHFADKYPGVTLSGRDLEENRLEIHERNGGMTS